MGLVEAMSACSNMPRSNLGCSNLRALTIMNGRVPTCAVLTSFHPKNAGWNIGWNRGEIGSFYLLFLPSSKKEKKNMGGLNNRSVLAALRSAQTRKRWPKSTASRRTLGRFGGVQSTGRKA